jgi:lipopolysaccharide/colanic/teichoic acid biosynthesis glycosyltransferase
MNRVGPRNFERDAEVLTSFESAASYKPVHPDIAKLWRVRGMKRTTYESRLALDCRCVKNLSFHNDIIILFRPFGVVVGG